MAGTRRAYDTCAGCGHARIRHTNRGAGSCAATLWTDVPLDPELAAKARTVPCNCNNFRER